MTDEQLDRLRQAVRLMTAVHIELGGQLVAQATRTTMSPKEAATACINYGALTAALRALGAVSP